MKPSKPRKCPHCKQFFKPDPRTADRQRYCSAQACQQASHRKSQRGWSRKPENRKYFCGPIHRERVYAWREKHPDWRRRRSKKGGVLQDDCPSQPVPSQEVKPGVIAVLHDDCLTQSPLFVGLTAVLAGGEGVLHDDIAVLFQKMQAHGQAILGQTPGTQPKGAGYDEGSEAVGVSTKGSEDTVTVQLGGSSVNSG